MAATSPTAITMGTFSGEPMKTAVISKGPPAVLAKHAVSVGGREHQPVAEQLQGRRRHHLLPCRESEHMASYNTKDLPELIHREPRPGGFQGCCQARPRRRRGYNGGRAEQRSACSRHRGACGSLDGCLREAPILRSTPKSKSRPPLPRPAGDFAPEGGSPLSYEPSPKHFGSQAGRAPSPLPKNGSAALQKSVQVKATSPARVGIDTANNEFVVFRADDFRAKPFFTVTLRAWEKP